jgi:hypothetical protein
MKESIEVYGSLDINLVPFKVRNTIHYINPETIKSVVYDPEKCNNEEPSCLIVFKDKSVQVVGHSHLEAIKLLTNNG